MRKFDPIDIFFIALISAYFITLICIGITLLVTKIKFSKKPKTVEESTKKAKAKIVIKLPNIKIKELWGKIIHSKFIRILFMKEVPKKETKKTLPIEKIKVEEKSIIVTQKEQDKKAESKTPEKVKTENKIPTNKNTQARKKAKATTKKTSNKNGTKTTSNAKKKTSGNAKTKITTKKGTTNKSKTSINNKKKTTTSKNANITKTSNKTKSANVKKSNNKTKANTKEN